MGLNFHLLRMVRKTLTPLPQIQKEGKRLQKTKTLEKGRMLLKEKRSLKEKRLLKGK